MEHDLTEAAVLIRQAAKILDALAENNTPLWRTYEARLCDAGADKLELIADECELVAGVLSNFHPAE